MFRDLAVRHNIPRQVNRHQISFLNFHSWCKRVYFETGRWEEYNRLWRKSPDDGEFHSESILNKGLASGLNRLYREGWWALHAQVRRYPRGRRSGFPPVMVEGAQACPGTKRGDGLGRRQNAKHLRYRCCVDRRSHAGRWFPRSFGSN